MKHLIFAVTLAFISTPAVAGSCPMKIALIDKALSSGAVINTAAVKKLRDEGEALHKSGDHSLSVAVLEKAIRLGDIKG